MFGDSTVADYIHRSKLTGAGRNGVAGAAPFWDYLAAHRELSIFWTFVPTELYFVKAEFSDKVKACMLATNVWHFFVRKRAFQPCIDNLLATFSSKAPGVKTHDQIRNTLEILLIGYICGVVFMPGANQQFQFWFIAIVPILLAMTGVPLILTFWIPNYLYPINGRDPRHQHYFVLALSIWLITVGPTKNLFKDIYEVLFVGSKVKQN
jgi:hypothetical protein